MGNTKRPAAESEIVPKNRKITVGILTHLLPLSRPKGLPVYVTRIPAGSIL